MSETTKIEWTDATVNFWWGCTKVGPGCDHCYAEAWAQRFDESLWGAGMPRRKVRSAMPTLAKLQRGADRWEARHGRRRRVFLQSMSDLFDKEVPDEWFAEAWTGISLASRLELQIVTKRISFVEKRLAGRTWPQHAGLIISVVNQEEADRDIPRLLDLKARLGIPWIGLSMEPLLGPVDLTCIAPGQKLHGAVSFEHVIHALLGGKWDRLLRVPDEDGPKLDWVIVGGESGPGARPMHPDWARSLRDQCAAAGVPFLFKQWGEWLPGEIYHPESDRTAHSVHWQNGEAEYNGEHIDFTTETIDVHHAPGCPYEASLAEQNKARGYAEDIIARALVPNCSRARCRSSGHCRGDELPWLTVVRRVGKKAAGRLLDGIEHNGFPQVRHG